MATYHGMDLEAKFKAAGEKIKAATVMPRIYAVIAQLLADLNDSHTYFIPTAGVLRLTGAAV